MHSKGSLGFILFRAVRDSCSEEVACEQRPGEVKECACRCLGESFLQREPQSQGPRRESWRPTSLGEELARGAAWGPAPRAAGTLAFSLGGRGVLHGYVMQPELLWLQEKGTVVGRSRSREPPGEAAGHLQGRGEQWTQRDGLDSGCI